MKFLVALICTAAVVLATNSAMAQGPGGRGGPGGGGFGGGFGGPGGGTDLFGLLNNESVQKELEVVPSQLDDIRKLGEEMRNSMRDMFQGMRNASEDERREMFSKLQSAREDVEKDLEKVLMPAQLQRLKQIQVQQQSRGRGGVSFANPRIVEALGLSEAQLADLRDKAEELQNEMRAKVEELRKEADAELLQMLTPEQQKKWKEMMGEPFEMEQPRGGFQGGARGGQRGPGGRGGNDDGEI
ncbi:MULTISPECIES: hypothetical protein [Pirellulaceae]|uniref:hypothetical protein n=1 Tax=Pirellulaceae TaxID=2691357 RepID=UPI0013048821|nr:MULTISPECIES: hypothetical protein [Pirellulaceae]